MKDTYHSTRAADWRMQSKSLVNNGMEVRELYDLAVLESPTYLPEFVSQCVLNHWVLGQFDE
jgi:hypothetical protein